LQWLVLNRPETYDEEQVSEFNHNSVDGGNAREHLDSADTDVWDWSAAFSYYWYPKVYYYKTKTKDVNNFRY
jgi:hypothetical protein